MKFPKINLTLLEKYFYLKIRKVTVLTFHLCLVKLFDSYQTLPPGTVTLQELWLRFKKMERKLQGKSLFLLPQVPYPTISGDLFKVKVSLIFIVLKLKK